MGDDCPLYEGERKCGLHSEYWNLDETHEEKLCRGDYKSCEEYFKTLKEE